MIFFFFFFKSCFSGCFVRDGGDVTTSLVWVLIRFDISGAGACLKRYTDPSFVRHETSSYEASWDDIQREKKSLKAKVCSTSTKGRL